MQHVTLQRSRRVNGDKEHLILKVSTDLICLEKP